MSERNSFFYSLVVSNTSFFLEISHKECEYPFWIQFKPMLGPSVIHSLLIHPLLSLSLLSESRKSFWHSITVSIWIMESKALEKVTMRKGIVFWWAGQLNGEREKKQISEKKREEDGEWKILKVLLTWNIYSPSRWSTILVILNFSFLCLIFNSHALLPNLFSSKQTHKTLHSRFLHLLCFLLLFNGLTWCESHHIIFEGGKQLGYFYF